MNWRILALWSALLPSWPVSALADDWAINFSKSQLAFIATWEGSEFQGVFQRFDAEMVFDVETPANSRFNVSIDITSVDTNSTDRDEAMAGREWFFFRRYPRATFVTSAIRAVGNRRYEAEGTLTIKGISRPIVLPFAWMQFGDRAEMDGEVVIRRTDFNIGEGEWASGGVIGLDVRVIVDLTLQLKARDAVY